MFRSGRCGRPFAPPAPPEKERDLSLLSPDEQVELTGLVAAALTPACARCGQSATDVTRLTYEQRERTVQLLRAAYGVRDSWWPSTPGR